MMLYITNIDFDYQVLTDGFNNVGLKFDTTGLEYTLKGSVIAPKADYLDNLSDIDAQRTMVKNKIVEHVNNTTIYITNIGFNYGDFKDGFNSVRFNFVTLDLPFEFNGPVTISKTDYMANQGDINALRQLVKDKIIADLS